jgi:hypothetical protein
MLIGLRLVLVVGVLLAASALLGYLFTRNPKMLRWAKRVALGTLSIVALIVGIYAVERLLVRMV